MRRKGTVPFRLNMRKKLRWIIPAAILALMTSTFFLYTGIYYRAEESAYDAMRSDERVEVARTDYGWLFDGPSDETSLIFYPGAKVEAKAYAPMLRLLAEEGMDVQVNIREKT